MWLSQQLTPNEQMRQAERGTVTLNTADGLETEGTASTRHMALYAPYGYRAAVPVGEEVLLLPLADGIAAAGTRVCTDGLQAGEVALTSAGGASLLLKNDGTVVINGALVINKEGQLQNGT